MKRKTKIELEQDVSLYRVLSLLIFLVLIGTIIISVGAYQNQQEKLKDSSVSESQLLLSTTGDYATLRLDLNVGAECQLAQVWHSYLINKNGGTEYPFEIECP